MSEYRIASNQLVGFLKSSSTAVVVIDKQRGYIEAGQPLIKSLNTDTDKLASRVPQIDDFIEKTREAGIRVIWTQMIEDLQDSVPSIIRKMRLEGSPSFIDPKNESFQIYGRVKPRKDETIFKKKSYDSFSTTGLDEYLKRHQIKTVVLVGAYTSRCVLATAFVANGLGYNVFVAKDLVGEPEKFVHEAKIALGIIDSILGYVVDSEFLQDVWKK